MLKSLFALAAGVLTATAALATPSQCALGTLTAHYADSSTASWSDCTGAWDGNLAPNTSAAIAIIIGLEFGLGSAAFIGKSDDSSNPWSSDPGNVNGGTLNFASPWGGLFVVGLHGGENSAPIYIGEPVGQGGAFSLYLFDGTVGGGITSIDFDTVGLAVNRQGAGKNLSHAALYGGAATPQRTALDTPPPSSSIPEPGSAALLGLALLGAVSASRRTRRSARVEPTQRA